MAGTATGSRKGVEPRPAQVRVPKVVPPTGNPVLIVALGPTVVRVPIVAPSLKEVAPMNEVPAPNVVRTTVARAVSEVGAVVEEAPSQAVMHLPVPPRLREPVVRPFVRSGPFVHGLRW